MIEKIKKFVAKLIRFLTYDIWRLTGEGLSVRKMNLYNILKSFVLAFRNIDSQEINTRSAALTYKTLLSIVPMLAVMFAIAQGFGLQGVVKDELMRYFAGQADAIEQSMSFIDKSLEYAKSGVFLGVGIVLLLYAVINLLSSIEDNFNTIWNIKKSRTYYRQFTDFVALIIIAPIFFVCNASLSVLLSYTANMDIIGTVVSPFLQLVPFLLTISLFTFLFSYIPNTKVKFSAALMAGVFTGIVYQIFQLLYISGQIWISKYNAIYGSFAALPLLMLWLQLSWFIMLFGVQLSFSFQNVNKFSFESETKNISRRYKNFVVLAIVALIVKRFETEEKPYTADELSSQYAIPTKLTSELIYYLLDLNIIVETPSDDALVPAYVPAIDINKLSVAYLFDKMNLYGSEDFVIDTQGKFKNVWDHIVKIDNMVIDAESKTLIKDL